MVDEAERRKRFEEVWDRQYSLTRHANRKVYQKW